MDGDFVEVDKRIDTGHGCCVVGHASVVHRVGVYPLILEHAETFDKGTVRVCHDGEKRAFGIAKRVDEEHLLATRAQGLCA